VPGKHVIVVGAGLAGLSCAFELAERDCSVTVLECRSVLGGRTSSWIEDGMPVESGLHKFLGIYRALPDLLHRAGVDPDQLLTWVDELAYLMPNGPNAHFTVSPYHHPLDTLKTTFSNTDFLPTSEKAKLGAMAAAGMAKCASDPHGLDRASLATYAAGFGVGAEIIERVLSTTTQAILFLPADRFSAYTAFAPMVEGMKSGLTMRIGAFNGGMTEVMIEPISRALLARGGTVRCNAPVADLIVEHGRVVGVRSNNESIRADHVVLAVPLKSAQELLSRALGSHEWLEQFQLLPSLSAATIQFELDRPVLESDRTNFSSTGMCCFAEQSRTTFRHLPGRLSVILYPPERFLQLAPEAILEQVYEDAESLGIELRRHVQQYRIVNHPHDFYAMHPGTEELRPTQASPVSGLSFAGDYTKQRYSATMEGAVMSGQLAAEAVLA
jgi:15-cis-phytoene desaturase